ncbi:hypothetical protein GGP79_002054 [Salinibacter ruber]|nr:hypothetical protein [Salinibacter ruber]MCS3754100.1 hypothetical protein [Salinibacter ruber]
MVGYALIQVFQDPRRLDETCDDVTAPLRAPPWRVGDPASRVSENDRRERD